MIPMGSLGDRFGRKRMLLAGLAIFGAASAACAFANSAGVLIAARALQGIGGAAMMPLSMAMLPVLFQDREERTAGHEHLGDVQRHRPPARPDRRRLAARPLLAGAAVFLINVPLVAVGLLALTVYLPESRSARTQPIDVPGIALSSTGLVALIYGLIEAGAERLDERERAGADRWPASPCSPRSSRGSGARRTRWSTSSLFSQPGLHGRDGARRRSRTSRCSACCSSMPQYFQDVGGSDAARHRRAAAADDRRPDRRRPGSGRCSSSAQAHGS